MRKLLLTTAAALAISGPAHAVVAVGFDTSGPIPIGLVTPFSVNGAGMAGLSVTVNFVGGGSETAFFAPLDGTSGAAMSATNIDIEVPTDGVSGVPGGLTATGNEPLWVLSQGGDTYGGAWFFNFFGNYASTGPTPNVASIVLNGEASGIVFDIPTPNANSDQSEDTDGVGGTPNSEDGIVYTDVSDAINDVIDFGAVPDERDYSVTYRNPAGFGVDSFFDVFFEIEIGFGPDGLDPTRDEQGTDVVFFLSVEDELQAFLPPLFAFVADTDEVQPFVDDEPNGDVPAPGMLGLFGLGLAGLGLARRRRGA